MISPSYYHSAAMQTTSLGRMHSGQHVDRYSLLHLLQLPRTIMWEKVCEPFSMPPNHADHHYTTVYHFLSVWWKYDRLLATILMDFAHIFKYYPVELYISWSHLSIQILAPPLLHAICHKYGILYDNNSFTRMVYVMFDKSMMQTILVQYRSSQDNARSKSLTWKAMHWAIDQ